MSSSSRRPKIHNPSHGNRSSTSGSSLAENSRSSEQGPYASSHSSYSYEEFVPARSYDPDANLPTLNKTHRAKPVRQPDAGYYDEVAWVGTDQSGSYGYYRTTRVTSDGRRVVIHNTRTGIRGQVVANLGPAYQTGRDHTEACRARTAWSDSQGICLCPTDNFSAEVDSVEGSQRVVR